MHIKVAVFVVKNLKIVSLGALKCAVSQSLSQMQQFVYIHLKLKSQRRIDAPSKQKFRSLTLESLLLLPIFHIVSQTLKTHRKFSDAQKETFRYLKCSLMPELLNAPALDVLRHVEPILKQNGGFFNNPPKFQKNPNSSFKSP